MLDAICVNVLMDQITVSLPLFLYSPAWSLQIDPSDVAYELFQLFYIQLPVDIRQNLVPQTTRHKKKEVDVAGEIFLEEQCHSNRPAFCLLEHGCDETFHLYSAMGLPHQHDDVRVLLARCRSSDIALLWIRFLTEQYGLTLTEAQLQGEDNAMIKWDWICTRLRWNVSFDTPNKPFDDVLHDMKYIHFQWWCSRRSARLKRGANIAHYFIILMSGIDAMFYTLRFSATRSCAFFWFITICFFSEHCMFTKQAMVVTPFIILTIFIVTFPCLPQETIYGDAYQCMHRCKNEGKWLWYGKGW